MHLQNKKKFLFGLFFGILLSGALLLGAFYIFSGHVFAVTVDQGIGTTIGLGTADLETTIINIIRWALGLLGLVAVVIIMYGGFVWMTAAGNTDKVQKAKKIITRGVIGLVIILLAFAIVSFIMNTLNKVTGGTGVSCTAGESNGCYECNSSGNGWIRHSEWLGCHVTGNDPFRTTLVDPGDGDTDIVLCSIIQAFFNGNIEPTSITGHAHLYVEDGAAAGQVCTNNNNCLSGLCTAGACVGDEVAGTWEIATTNAKSLVFKPAVNYERLTQYRVVLDGGDTGITEAVPKRRDVPFAGQFWLFTTGDTTLDQPPTVTAIYPNDAANNMCLNTLIQSTFSSRMYGASINMNTVKFTDITGVPPGVPVDTALRSPFYYPDVYNFSTRPAARMSTGHHYSVSLLGGNAGNDDPANGIMDVCLNHLDGNYDLAEGGDFMTVNDHPVAGDAFPWDFFADTDSTNTMCVPQITGMSPADGKYDNAEPVKTISGSNFGLSGQVIFNNQVNNIGNCFNGQNRPTANCLVGWGNTITTHVPGGPADFQGSVPSSGAVDGGVAVEVLPGICRGGANDQVSCVDATDCPGGQCIDRSNSVGFDVTSPQIEKVSGLNNQPHGGIGQYVSVIKRGDADAGFGTLGAGSRVYFRSLTSNAEIAGVVPPCDEYWHDNYIVVKVPDLSSIVTACANPWNDPACTASQVAVQVVKSDGTRSNLSKFIYTNEAAGPGLCSITPQSCGSQNDNRVANGESFGATGTVNFALPPNPPVNAPVISWVNSTINFRVPPSVNNANDPYDVSVQNSVGASNPVPFDVPCGGIPHVEENASCNIPQGFPSPSPRAGITEACQNVVLSARFSTDMNNEAAANPLFGSSILNPANYEIVSCGVGGVFTDSNCTTPVSVPPLTFLPIDVGNGVIHDQVIMTPAASLAADTWYRVTIQSSVTSVAPNNVRMNADYVWHFKTKTGTGNCPVDSVALTPGNLTRGYPITLNYAASAVNDSQCEILNSSSLAWTWASTTPAVANFNPAPAGNTAVVDTIAEGSTNIRATTEGKTGQSSLRVVANYCQRNSDCTLSGQCPNSTCDLVNTRCTPEIHTLTPNKGPGGTTITIDGCYLGNQRGNVWFGTFAGQYLCEKAWNNNQITVTAPAKIQNLTDVAVNAERTDGVKTNNLNFGITDQCEVGGLNPPVGVPASGMPGLCAGALVPVSGRPGDFTSIRKNYGYNLLNNANGLDSGNTFVRFTSNLDVTYDDVLNRFNGMWASNEITRIRVPVGTETGPVRVFVNGCPSNPQIFTKSCSNSNQCLPGECCKAGACVDAAECSSGGAGQLCQITDTQHQTADLCQAGPTVTDNNYRCIDTAGHRDPNNPAGPGYPVPAVAGDCRTCCYPGQVSSSNLSCVVADQGPEDTCTGNDRGLYCGCTSDGQCGNNGQAQGCGESGQRCCFGRPTVISVTASPCRNTSIVIDFSQAMRRASINDKTIFLAPSNNWAAVSPSGGFPGSAVTTATALFNNRLAIGTDTGTVADTINGREWSVGSIDPNGNAGTVHNLEPYANQLFAAANTMYVYNGTTWERNLVSGTPQALAVFNDRLFVGSADAENSVIRNYTWDANRSPNDWLADQGNEYQTGSDVVAMKVFNGLLYASTVDGRIHASSTNGKSWAPFTAPLPSPANALEVYDNNLYAGLDNGDVYRLDGGAWVSFSKPTTSHIRTMRSYSGRLYVGDSVGHILLYDGTTWASDRAAAQPGEAIGSMLEFNGRLYAGAGRPAIPGSASVLSSYIVPARLSVSGARVTLSPKANLDAGTYRLIVRGDEDGTDALHHGVLNNQGVGMRDFAPSPLDYEIGSGSDSYQHIITTGDNICKLDQVQIKVTKMISAAPVNTDPPDNYTCATNDCADDMDLATNGNQHYYNVNVYDQSGNEITADKYTWTVQDPKGVISVGDVLNNDAQKIVTDNVQNGTATVKVEVEALGAKKAASAQVNVSLCENPWPNLYPPDSEDFPFEDSAAHLRPPASTPSNFSIFYCRDQGNLPILKPTSDVISHMSNPQPNPNDGKNDMIKEFFFLRDNTSDAIGIRVMENEDGVSPTQWYREQFGPTAPDPQALTVDGYPAIRAGRTVYVAATNLVGSSLYHNIYLISYNDGASSETVSIYNRLIDNWRFNINVDDKAAMMRDMQRLNDLNDIYAKLLAYKTANGHFPLLEGGTFIPGMATSKWPSWQETLGAAIGGNLPVDPVNDFAPITSDGSGLCDPTHGFNDPNTCWNARDRIFQAPDASHIYMYMPSGSGDFANLFTKLEYTGPGNWLPAIPVVSPCTGNASCDGVFNYQFDVTGTAQDHDGPVINRVYNALNNFPLAFSTLFGTVPLTVDAQDAGSGVSKVEFFIDGIRQFTDTDGTNIPSWSWTFDTRRFADRTAPAFYTFTVVAYDVAGNRTSQSYTAHIGNSGVSGDNTPPFVQITTPGENATVHGTFPITTYASDNIGISSFIITITGGTTTPTNPCGASPCIWNWDSTVLLNGQYTIHAEVFDLNGNRKTHDVSIRIDNTDTSNPTIGPLSIVGTGGFCDSAGNAACTTPGQAGGTCGGTVMCRYTGTIALSAPAADPQTGVSRVVFFIDGVAKFTDTEGTNGVWQWDNWNSAQYANASHNVSATAYDQYGNPGSTGNTPVVTFNTSADRIPPTVEFLGPPVADGPTPGDGETLMAGFTVAVNSHDNLGVAQVNFYFDYIYIASNNPTNPSSYTFDNNFVAGLRSGCHTFSVKAVDIAGNISSELTRQVGIRQNCIGGEGSGPSIRQAYVTPCSIPPSGSITIHARVVDVDGVQSVVAHIKNSPGGDYIGNPVTMTLNTPPPDHIYTGTYAPPGEGAYYVDIEATDRLGQTTLQANIPGQCL